MAQSAELKGFDSYTVSLGDEMRGRRASMGKSLLDVQRDLRIKAAHIDAIENADASALPNSGFISGYVRAYARYLGMEEEPVLRRFCEEAGVQPGQVIPLRARAGGAGTARQPDRRADLDAAITGSHLAVASRASAFNADFGAIARGIGSLATLGALVAGLGYGGWALLQNIQRVDFTPTPDAPLALAEAPHLDGLTEVARAGVAPAPVIDADALASVYAAQEAPPPKLNRRDGPIAALDPDSAGVYALRSAQAVAAAEAAKEALAEAAIPDPAFQRELDRLAALAAAPTPQATPLPSAVELVFTKESWIRVRDGEGRVVKQALMRGGENWVAPEDRAGLELRAGNAGSVFVMLDGLRYGPLGAPGGVVSRVSLDRDAIRATLPLAPIAQTAAAELPAPKRP